MKTSPSEEKELQSLPSYDLFLSALENDVWRDMWAHGMTGTFASVSWMQRKAADGNDSALAVMEVYTSRCVARKLLRNDEPRYDNEAAANQAIGRIQR